MIDDAARRSRLVARHHLARSAATVATATRDLVALHSSDPLTPHLALRARVPGYRTADLDASLEATTDAQDALWRLHAMRRTLWVAPAEDVGWLDASVGRDVARSERTRLRGWVQETREDAEAWLAALEDAALAAVAERPGIPTRELTSALPELASKITVGSGKWRTETSIGPRLLYVLAMELKLRRRDPSGSWKSSQYGWAPAERVETWNDGPDAARARLVARYLARFGPATETDVAWWTGLTLTRTRKALDAAGARAVEVTAGPAWDAPGAEDEAEEGARQDAREGAAGAARGPTAAGAEPVALLPGLDPTPMGYKERDWFLGPHEAALFDRNGNVGPTVWLGGRIVGGWAVDADGRVRSRLLEDVGAEAEARIAEEAEALEGWLDGTAITPRFRTPLERELS